MKMPLMNFEMGWNIDQTELKVMPKYLGKFYYIAKDPNSVFTEHEIDYIYQAEPKIYLIQI